MDNPNTVNKNEETRRSPAVITPLGMMTYEDSQELELIDFMTMLEEIRSR